MQVLAAQPLLLAVLPLALAVAGALLGRRSVLAAAGTAALSAVLVLLSGVSAFATIAATGPAGDRVGWSTSELASPVTYYPFIGAGESTLRLAGAVDSLAAAMLVVVGFVALCVVIFSAGYLHGDPGVSRYFALISAFVGSMSLLVVSATFTTLFIGWELVGACSYLLIGFWFERAAPTRSAIKAFVTTRIADVGLLVGIAVLFVATGSDTFETVFSAAQSLDRGVLTGAAVMIAVGAMGKSAQFPFHGWLPDAMEGPTPASALIHAATMVAAGAYLVVRAFPLFDAAPAAQALLLWAGVVSAAGAGLIATAQTDIKRVLAFSTISQLGFMFAALGVGAWGAAFFHLTTHAAFKALLFLTAGSVIHGSGTQDLREMGALRSRMPASFAGWTVGVLALSGIAPLAGFFSKDAVLETVLHASPAAGAVLLAASVLTAFYCARATRLAFFGEARGGGAAHESGPLMLLPLAALAVPSVALGAAGPALARAIGSHPEPLAIGVSVAATVAALAGGAAGWWFARPDRALSRTGALIARSFGWDELTDVRIAGAARSAARALWSFGDRLAVDGLVEGSARVADRAASAISRMQSGDTQHYVTVVTATVALLLSLAFWLGR